MHVNQAVFAHVSDLTGSARTRFASRTYHHERAQPSIVSRGGEPIGLVAVPLVAPLLAHPSMHKLGGDECHQRITARPIADGTTRHTAVAFRCPGDD